MIQGEAINDVGSNSWRLPDCYAWCVNVDWLVQPLNLDYLKR